MPDDRESGPGDEGEVLYRSEPRNLMALVVRRYEHGSSVNLETVRDGGEVWNTVRVLPDELLPVARTLIEAFEEAE